MKKKAHNYAIPFPARSLEKKREPYAKSERVGNIAHTITYACICTTIHTYINTE